MDQYTFIETGKTKKLVTDKGEVREVPIIAAVEATRNYEMKPLSEDDDVSEYNTRIVWTKDDGRVALLPTLRSKFRYGVGRTSTYKTYKRITSIPKNYALY